MPDAASANRYLMVSYHGYSLFFTIMLGNKSKETTHPLSLNDTKKSNSRFMTIILVCCAFVGTLTYLHSPFNILYSTCAFRHSTPQPTCSQFSALYPGKSRALWSEIDAVIATDEFKTKAIARLAGAVRIP